MPTIVVASPKGGAGKSTTSLILGLVMAERGASVTLVDADERRSLADWRKDRERPVTIIGNITDANFVSIVDKEAERQDVVIVDLEGAATRIMSRAAMRADLVLIPMQPSKLDAKGAAQMVELIRQEEEILRKPIPFRICMNRTSEAVPTKTTKAILRDLEAKGIPALSRHINQRQPFNDLFVHDCTFQEMKDMPISGVPQAIKNANEFTDEVIGIIKDILAKDAA